MSLTVIIRERVPKGIEPREERVWEWRDVQSIDWLEAHKPLTIDRTNYLIRDRNGKLVATIHLDAIE